MEPVVSVTGLHKSYRSDGLEKEVLRCLDLSAGQGEFVCVMGVSGCGKTTLLNVLGGLDTDFAGDVRVAGTMLRGLDDRGLSAFRNSKIGFIFQHFNLLDHLTCAENAMLPSYFVRDPAASVAARVAELLARVGMADKAGRRPPSLSGGEKQRVAIARALLLKPVLMLCDEPTGDLDYATADSILDLFDSLRREEKITLVVVTHEEHLARRATRVVRMQGGRFEE
ncbi:MAG: ABC transporter ATP-binding protein [Deltaproteobacteria bacterium]|nr:ABC transporter ATP-binding protein [Deltaproteobacteria bacterium]